MKTRAFKAKSAIFTLSGLMMVLSITSCSSDDPSSDDTTSGGTYLLSSGATVSLTGNSYSSTTADESAIKVTDGILTLTDCTITKSGNTTSSDNSSFYGVNAAVLSSSSSADVTISGGSITTDAKGANAAVAYGGSLYLSDVTINCSGQYSRGIHATNGGSITAVNLTATTAGANSSVIATDRGGGTVNVTGGTFSVSGTDAAVIYSTGTITASGITGTSAVGEAAVIEGSNSATLTNCNLTAGSTLRGILILQSGSGDASGATGYFTMTSGTLKVTGSATPVVEVVTNSTGNIVLTSVDVTCASGILMKVDYNTRWSTNGATGNLYLSGGKTYVGDIEADSYSAANVSVSSSTVWQGAFDKAASAKSSSMTIDGGTWTLTGNSNVDSITLKNGAAINKSGYTLTYNTLNNVSGTIND